MTPNRKPDFEHPKHDPKLRIWIISSSEVHVQMSRGCRLSALDVIRSPRFRKKVEAKFRTTMPALDDPLEPEAEAQFKKIAAGRSTRIHRSVR